VAKRPTRGESAALSELTPDPQNRRLRTPRNLDMIAASLKSVGAARSIVLDENNQILAGNGVHEAAPAAGISRVRIIDADGDELIAVRRRGLTDDQKRELAIFDNRTGELAAWDVGQLQADADAGLSLGQFWNGDEMAALLAQAKRKAGHSDPDFVPAERATEIKPGDLFALGSAPDSVRRQHQRVDVGAGARRRASHADGHRPAVRRRLRPVLAREGRCEPQRARRKWGRSRTTIARTGLEVWEACSPAPSRTCGMAV
jgi:hypothetical protein